MPVADTTSNSKGICYIQPSDLESLEAELQHRFGDDCDAFPDAWRAVRAKCKSTLVKFAKSGGEAIPTLLNVDSSVGEEKEPSSSSAPPPYTSSPYTFPSTSDLDLLVFSLRYSSMGKSYADLLVSGGGGGGGSINNVLLDMVTYNAMYLSGEGFDVAIDLNKTHQMEMAKEVGGGGGSGDSTTDATVCATSTSSSSSFANATDRFIANMKSMILIRGQDGSEADSNVDAKRADGDDDDGDFPPATLQWLRAVTAFISGCEKIIANCSGSTSIALSDTSLFLVRGGGRGGEEKGSRRTLVTDGVQGKQNAKGGGDENKEGGEDIVLLTTPFLAPSSSSSTSSSSSPPHIRVSYSDYSVSETGARLWGGGVGLSLLLAERAPMLLLQPPMPSSSSSSSPPSSSTLTTITPLLVVELGAGVALPTCTLAASAMSVSEEALSGSAGQLQQRPISFVVTDVFTSILECAGRNVKRQLLAKEVGEMQTKKKGSPSSAVSVRTEIVDFFAVEKYLAECSAEKAEEGEVLPSPLPPSLLPASADLLLSTDIVYDYHIGKAGIATVGHVLKPCSGPFSPSSATTVTTNTTVTPSPFTSLDDVLLAWRSKSNGLDGGIALLCCESHRDAMPLIRDFFAANRLTLLWHEGNVQDALRYYTIPEGVTISSCELFVVVKYA